MGSGHPSFIDVIGSWRALVSAPPRSITDLDAQLSALYRAIYDADFAKLDPSDVKATAAPASAALFDLYLTIRDRIPEWRAAGLIGPRTPRLVRDGMRVIRYTIDIIGEVAGGYERLESAANTYPAFGGPLHLTLMHPALAEGTRIDFQAGDVILMRGRLNNSAAIARIGDVDSQFSHTGIVHVDPDGTRWLVEALIEDGSVLTPLDEALTHGTGRAMLLRHRDRALAQRAGRAAAERVRAGTSGLFSWIPYDFSMEPAGEAQFFCSKLVGYAYRKASGGAFSMPSYGTKLAMENRDFFERLGVTAVDTFAPGDLEMETAFDVVAEWRDYRVTSPLRAQDLIMSSLFDGMDQRGLRFKATPAMAIAALAGRLTSFWPDAVKRLMSKIFGLPRIPRNMPIRTIATIGMLHKTVEPLLELILGHEIARIRTSGRPLHPREVQLELGRIADASGGEIGYLAAEPAHT